MEDQVLDLRLIREQTEAVERSCAQRGGDISLRPILEADAARRRLMTTVEELKAERNRASEAIGQARRQGDGPTAAMASVRDIGERIKALDARVQDADAPLEALLLELPNLPHPCVPVGSTAEDNVEIRRWGDRHDDSSSSREQHEMLGEALGVLDFERASRLPSRDSP